MLGSNACGEVLKGQRTRTTLGESGKVDVMEMAEYAVA